nr:Mobile element protein [Escherichia coli]
MVRAGESVTKRTLLAPLHGIAKGCCPNLRSQNLLYYASLANFIPSMIAQLSQSRPIYLLCYAWVLPAAQR